MRDALLLILLAVSLTGTLWVSMPELLRAGCATVFLSVSFYLGLKILKNEPYF